MKTDDRKIYVTKDGLAKIQDELHQLKTTKRKEIAGRIQDAKELGDLSENAEYIEAKEEQGFVESRILELEQMLKRVEMIDHKKTSNVQIGSKITATNGEGKEIAYTIVGSSEADPLEGRISNESPIGKAFLGHKAGDEVVVETPRGQQTFVVKKVE